MRATVALFTSKNANVSKATCSSLLLQYWLVFLAGSKLCGSNAEPTTGPDQRGLQAGNKLDLPSEHGAWSVNSRNARKQKRWNRNYLQESFHRQGSRKNNQKQKQPTSKKPQHKRNSRWCGPFSLVVLSQRRGRVTTLSRQTPSETLSSKASAKHIQVS